MKLGALEKKVMTVVWKHYHCTPFVVRDVVDRLKDDYAYNTILTVVTHLYEKGLLKRSKEGKTYEYMTCKSRTEFVDEASRTAFNRLRKEYGDVAIAHFAQLVDEIDPQVLARAKKTLTEEE